MTCVWSKRPLVINVIKETYNEFKTTLYNDFSTRLDDFQLPNPFQDAKEVPSFKICDCKINFLGADRPSKFDGAGCDIAYFNEVLPISQLIFDQVEMRCTQFWIADYNPKVSIHWVYEAMIPRMDVGYMHSTFIDNPFLSVQEKNKILSYEPTPHNKEQGTSDNYNWNVFGLGLRMAQEGLIFKNIEYIDEFPEGIEHIYGLDFGFTADPTALVKYGQEGNNIYLELLYYQSTETETILVEMFDALKIDRSTPIIADSADRFVSEHHGVQEMVRAIREADYACEKVSKKKGIMYSLGKMKEFNIKIIRNLDNNLYTFAQIEAENYKMKDYKGLPINTPEDKYNHFWDAARYAFIGFNANTSIW